MARREDQQGTIGTRLRDLREAYNLNQYQLDEAVGLAKGSINHYETGRRIPDLVILLRIAVVLKADLYWLCGVQKPARAAKVYKGNLWADVNTGTKTRRLRL